MDKYSKKVAIAKVKGKGGDSWLVWMNRAKNGFVFLVSIVFFSILMAMIFGGGMALPNSYIAGFFLNAIGFPIVTNALKQFIIFSMAWGMVKHGQTEETAPWWKYKILSLTGCLPGTVSGNITQATPAVEDEKRNPGAGGGKKIEIVEHSADKSHSDLTE